MITYCKECFTSIIPLIDTDISIQKFGMTVIGALRQMWAEHEAGASLTIDQKRFRIQMLPL